MGEGGGCVLEGAHLEEAVWVAVACEVEALEEGHGGLGGGEGVEAEDGEFDEGGEGSAEEAGDEGCACCWGGGDESEGVEGGCCEGEDAEY